MHRPRILVRWSARLLAIGLAAAPYGDAAAADLSRYTFAESSLGRYPQGAIELGATLKTDVSPDSRHVSRLMSVAGERNGLARMFKVLTPRRYAVVRDGVTGQSWDQIDGASMDWSPDGRHLQYVAAMSRAQHAIVDDSVSPPYDRVLCRGFVGQSHLPVYAGWRGDSGIVVVDGAVRASAAGLEWFWISLTGDRIACVSKVGDKRWITVGPDSASWDDVEYLGFTENSRHYFYIAREGSAVRLVLDRTPGPTYEGAEQLFCTDDLQSCTAWVKTGGRWRLMRGDSLGPTYDDLDADRPRLRVSPDRRHVAYVTGKRSKTLHVDGSDFGPFDEAGSICWIGTEGRWSALGLRGQQPVLLTDGRETALPKGSRVWGPFASSDGARWGYILRERKSWSVVVDGTSVLSCEDVCGPTLAFNRDGRSWAVVAKQGGEWSLFLDGQRAPGRYRDVHWPGPAFADDGSVSFIVYGKDDLRSVTCTPASEP